jgi:pyridoxamine 5'-phosphate oxidase
MQPQDLPTESPRPPERSPAPLEEPLLILERWIEQGRPADGSPTPMAFVTVGPDGRPSARMVGLKRIEDRAILFTSALWTRKARELAANPHVSLLFHWPALGRQAHVAGRAEVAGRGLAQELFAERPLAHRVQTLVSRQGEPIEDLDALRQRHAHLMSVLEAPPPCPPDWGAIRVIPEAIELWSERPDRLHERLLYERPAGGEWRVTRLAP